MSGRYQFGYEPGSLYERLVQLVDRHRPPGGQLVVDLGCGYGAIAEPLRDLGLDYAGVDGNPEAVEDLRRRGFTAATVDLGAIAELSDTLTHMLGGAPLAAVVMADVIEHLTNAEDVLGVVQRQMCEAFQQMRNAIQAHEIPAVAPLVVSIPNVSHVDLAAKLLVGRWDVSPTGLLDATHVGFYTPSRLEEVMGRLGWQELERADWEMVYSDQHFPEDLAVLAPGSPLHELLHQVRRFSAPGTETNQFVRAYRPLPLPAGGSAPGATISGRDAPVATTSGDGAHSEDAPGTTNSGGRAPGGDPAAVFLSVVVPVPSTALDDLPCDTMLSDAFASLASQSDQDFEVLLVPTGSYQDPGSRHRQDPSTAHAGSGREEGTDSADPGSSHGQGLAHATTTGTASAHEQGHGRLDDLLHELPDHLARRTRVLSAPAPSGADQSPSPSGADQSPAPAADTLAAALADARGRWVAVLDGAVAFAHWVEVFHQLAAGAPGKVLHAAVAIQRGRFATWTTANGPLPGFDPVTWPEPERLPGAGGDWLSWLWAPASADLPAGCGFAVPRESGFDLAALARAATAGDHRSGSFAALTLRLASLAGMVESTQVTSIRRHLPPAGHPDVTSTALPAASRGTAGEGSASPTEVVDPLRTWLRDQWIPVGPVELRRIQEAGHELADLRQSLTVHRDALAAAEAALADARRDLAALRASTSWLVTAPLRKLTEAARRRTRG